ncbi:hypothetical protein N0V82_008436 [Gnomoniopsis sp. IMI 355080]|nr:hypothetical protein N0V82_008436 [Gnomoniopsis sp. IMI 355080]
MRVTAPLASARIGDIEILGVQRVVELEALEVSPAAPYRVHHFRNTPNTTQPVPPSAINAIQSRTAVVVPCKDEPLEHIRGVWAAIPATSLIILVSGSQSQNYAVERDALADFCHATGRSGMAIQQRDPKVAETLRAAGMKELLDDEGDGLVHKGKGEGLVIGIALAAIARGPKWTIHKSDERCRPAEILADVRCDDGCTRSTIQGNVHFCCSNQSTNKGTCNGCNNRSPQQNSSDDHADGTPGYYKYIGFVDADNFVPGSVQEYCRAFSAGLHLAQAEDAMVRINWSSKPKIDNGKLHFKPSGRSSEIVNRWLNRLLTNIDACIDTGDAGGHEEMTDLICTGNAGEHAMTISLALKLRVASGYAIEPFHFLDIFERFAGKSKNNPDEGIDMHPETSSMAAIKFADTLPVSPASMSPVNSPMLSAYEESTQPTSPPIASTSLGKEPAVKQLPPPLDTGPFHKTAVIHNGAMSHMTPPESPTSHASPAKIQILQIRTINPHFHDNKGDDHVVRMWKQGLSAIYHSPVVFGLTQYREDLRTAVFGAGDNEGTDVPTPPFSSSASVATSSSVSVDDNVVNDAHVVAAVEWQPTRCRVYPSTGSMNLKELANKLERDEGSFWWSGKESHDPEKATMDGDGALDPSVGFDDVAVLGLGPVSREKRPEGDVDGFKAFVDEGR